MPHLQLLRSSLKELEAHKPAYIEANKYYNGSFQEPFQSLLMQRILVTKEVNYKAVLSAVPVDAVVEKLEIVDIQANDEEVTDILQDDVWKANQMQFVHKTAILAAEKFGDAYIFLWPEMGDVEQYAEEEAQAADAPVQEVTGVVASYQSPLKVRVFYDEANVSLKTHAVKRLRTGRGKQECAWLYLADGTIERYETPENKCGIEDFVYVEDVDNLVGEIPFIHLRNDLPYGKPLHLKAYGPQNQLTKLISNEMSGSDFNAFPQRYALAKTRGTNGGDDIDWSGEDDTVPDANGGDNVVSKLTSGPGRIWDLSGFDSVGQFASADVDQYLKPMEVAVKMMAVATGTPVYYFTADSTGGGTPTGESIRQRDARLNTKTGWHQQHLDAGFEEMLELSYYIIFGRTTEEDDISINIKWKPIEYVSEAEKLELIDKKVQLGIPIEVAFAEAGYDEATVKMWTGGKPNEAELARRITMLGDLGAAMEKLGTASVLGIDITEVQDVVTTLLQDIANLHEEPEEDEAP